MVLQIGLSILSLCTSNLEIFPLSAALIVLSIHTHIDVCINCKYKAQECYQQAQAEEGVILFPISVHSAE